MIESDFHLRSIVGRALSKRTRKFERIIVAERSDEVRRKLRNFLRGRSKTGFEQHEDFTQFAKKRLI
jgi:hypothetical protein